MKKLLLAFIFLALILVVALVILASQANSIAQKYKPDIEKAASGILGAAVNIGKIEASAFPNIKLKIDRFTVGEANNSEALSFKDLSLDIALLSVLKGKLEIVKLGLANPEITLLKTAQGISIKGLSVKPKAAVSNATAPSTAAKTDKKASISLPDGIGLSLENFSITDAKITLEDQVQTKTYKLDQINFYTSVGLAGSKVNFPKLSLSARALENMPITLEGSDLSYDLNSQEAIVPALNIKVFDGQIFVKANANLESFRSNASVKLSDLKIIAGSAVVSSVNADLNLNGDSQVQNINSNNFTFNLGQQSAKLEFSASNNLSSASLNSFKLTGFGGELSGNAKVDPASLRFSSDFTAKTLSIAELLAAAKPEMAGLLSGNIESLSSSISGNLGPNLLGSINGPVKILLKDASIKGYNLAAEVLKSVKNLPFIKGSLDSAVPESQRAALNDPNTAIQELSSSLNFVSGKANTQDFKMLSNIFALFAQGTVGLDLTLNLAAQIAFNETFSNVLSAKISELKALQDAQNRLTIPLTLSGTAPNIIVLPDATKLLELAAKGAIQEKAGKLLDQMLGGSKSDSKKKGLGSMLGF